MSGAVADRECLRCGNCCRWQGYVRVSPDEIDAIAGYLGLTVESFIGRYTRLTHDRGGLSLTEKRDGSCVFLAGNDCAIHDVKPEQCRGFPWDWHFPGCEEQCRAARAAKSGRA